METSAVLRLFGIYAAVGIAAGLVTHYVAGQDGGIAWPIAMGVLMGAVVTAGTLQARKRNSRR